MFCNSSRRLSLALSLALWGMALVVAGPVAARSTVYVSAQGNDAADGLASARPVRTLERARDVAKRLPAPRLILLSGQFVLTRTLMLGPSDSDTEWRGQSRASVVGTRQIPDGIVARQTKNVTFSNFEVRGFGEIGIDAIHSTGLKITGMTVRDIASARWSTAAIHLVGNTTDALISNNNVIGAGLNGIGVNTMPGQILQRVAITGNRVVRTCTTIVDCGAIYVSGRTRMPADSLISGNVVYDYGPRTTEGRGIYLDDWASFFTVRDNCIGGRGTYGMQIHGGHNNVITDNTIDVRQAVSALYYHPVNTELLSDMTGNRFDKNRIIANSSAKILKTRIMLPAQALNASANETLPALNDGACISALNGVRGW